MSRFSLGCYTVRVIDKNTEEYLSLGDLPQSLDLITVFTQYLQERSAERTIDRERNKLLRVRKSKMMSWSVYGIVEVGVFGYAADLFDVDEERVSHQRTVTEAEIMPFYFLAHLPSHRDEGVILLQRRANLGIRTVFLEDFAKHFEDANQGKKVVVNPLVPPQLVDELLQNGRLTKIRLIRYKLPSDIADAYDSGGHVENEGTAEIVLQPPRGGSFPMMNRIREIVGGKREIREMVELPGQSYDNVKVEIDVGGSKKTLDLSDVMKIRAYVDITQDVQIGGDGHPEFTSIDNTAQGLMSSLLSRLGTGSEDV